MAVLQKSMSSAVQEIWPFLGLLEKISSADFLDEFDQDGGVGGDPPHLPKLVNAGVQDPLQAAEAFEEFFGRFLDVLPGDPVGEEEFHDFIIMKPLQTAGQVFFLKTLPVSQIMGRGLFIPHRSKFAFTKSQLISLSMKVAR